MSRYLKQCFRVSLLSMAMCFWSSVSYARIDWVNESQNPIANIVKVPLVQYFQGGNGVFKKWQYQFQLEPDFPLQITKNWNLVIRNTIPLTNMPSSINPDASVFGLGDISQQFLLVPVRPEKVTWGVGAAINSPTATQQPLGNGKWTAGPALTAVTLPGKWLLGVLVNNVWSFAGQSSQPKVSTFEFEYFINYNFHKGWFIATSPEVEANWEAVGGQKWTVPFGGGIGRVFHLDKAHGLTVKLESYYNIIRPDSGPTWQVQLSLNFLFPEVKMIERERSLS